jgi:DNA-binding transcriptional ArsR family regulator
VRIGTDQTFAFLDQGTAMTTPLALAPLRRYLRHGTLPQLAALEAVVRLGSATRAADALCLAQPTISGHLRKLGEALGVRLFDLRGKRLVPTAAAIALLEATHEVSAALARCEDTLGPYRRDGSGPAPQGPATRPDVRA